jgi:sporulation protein YlmC with PRC-barrel domain
MRKLAAGLGPALALLTFAGVAAAQSGPTTGSGATATTPGGPAPTPPASPATPPDSSAGAASTMNAGTGRAASTAGEAGPTPPAPGAASGSMADGYKPYTAAGKDAQGPAAGGYSVRDLLGKTIVGPDGKEIAKVGDLVVGPDDAIKRVVVDVGGFLGIGAKPVAIDVDQLQKPADGRGDLRTSLTKDQLAALPRYDKGSKGGNG